MALSASELERLADNLLKESLKDCRCNKSRTAEYPILSPSQLKRRTSLEIPYSNLSEKQRLECKSKNLEYYSREGE